MFKLGSNVSFVITSISELFLFSTSWISLFVKNVAVVFNPLFCSLSTEVNRENPLAGAVLSEHLFYHQTRCIFHFRGLFFFFFFGPSA